MLPSFAKTVKEMLTRPSLDLTYEILKLEVLKRNTASAESRFRLLMQDEHQGDRKPTEFLRPLLELSDMVAENAPMIKRLFFSRLPSEVQRILAPTLEVNSVEHLANMADNILEFVLRLTTFLCQHIQ